MKKLSLLVCFSLLFSVASAQEKNKNKHKDKMKAKQKVMSEETVKDRSRDIVKVEGDHGSMTFSMQEKKLLSAYSVESKVKGKQLPKGLQKKVERGGTLPPGWQKKLVRGEVMERTVYTQAKPLPNSVLVKLPPQPEGTIVVEIEGEIVRLAQATMTIIDILGR